MILFLLILFFVALAIILAGVGIYFAVFSARQNNSLRYLTPEELKKRKIQHVTRTQSYNPNRRIHNSDDAVWTAASTTAYTTVAITDNTWTSDSSTSYSSDSTSSDTGWSSSSDSSTDWSSSSPSSDLSSSSSSSDFGGGGSGGDW